MYDDDDDYEIVSVYGSYAVSFASFVYGDALHHRNNYRQNQARNIDQKDQFHKQMQIQGQHIGQKDQIHKLMQIQGQHIGQKDRTHKLMQIQGQHIGQKDRTHRQMQIQGQNRIQVGENLPQ